MNKEAGEQLPDWWPSDKPYIIGDSKVETAKLPDNSIDAIVTDPPYEFGFMGKAWDSTGIAYDVEQWKQMLRVLKPGGYLLSFGGSRTYHRMACAIEDAGFEIRDMIMWVYGSGFPKSLNVGKAVDKLLGNEREEYIEKRNGGGIKKKQSYEGGFEVNYGERLASKGNSEWEGWGTALKPAHEPIVVARKSLSEKTVVENVLKWGTGGINIDGCRVGTEDNLKGGQYSGKERKDANCYGKHKNLKPDKYKQPEGRFPANLIHDGSDEVVRGFPNTVSKWGKQGKSEGGTLFGWDKKSAKDSEKFIGDLDLASRFFYCAKASKSERNKGCEGLVEKEAVKQFNEGMEGKLRSDGSVIKESVKHQNNHPTVKPVKLMRYLVRLVTPKGGLVLDPYFGSGTTGVACIEEGFNFIGIEKCEEYGGIIKERIKRPTRLDQFTNSQGR